jgi:tetratricopeptide (TPR) repeat protein
MAEQENPLVREAEKCFRLGDLAKAESLFRQAVESAPADPAALVGFARALYLRGAKAKALDLLARAEKADPRRAETLVTRAVIAEKEGDAKAAGDLLREAVRLAPRLFEARFNLGRLLAKAGRWDEAAAELEAAVAIEPEHAIAEMQLGGALIQANRLQDGLKHMFRAVEVNPTYLEGYLALADVLFSIEKDDAAESVLLLANRNIPEHREILERLAGLYQKRLDLVRARDTMRVLAGVAAKDPGVWKRLALLELTTGDPRQAEACAKTAIGLAPRDPEMHFTLGVIYESMKVFEPAKAAYRKAMEVGPRHWGAMTNLGRLLATDPTPALDEAVMLQEKACRLAPNEAAPAINLALALEAKGEKARAAEAAKAVLGLEGAKADVRAQAERLIQRCKA